MKTRGIVATGLAITMLLLSMLVSTGFTAGRGKLPAQFVGDWCLENTGDDNQSPTYRLGRCLPYENSDGGLTVRADGFAAHESRCKIVRAVADKNSNYLVKFRCSGEGETWTKNYWMSLKLLMSETNREPQ